MISYRQRHHDRGFSLVEAMISLLIVALAAGLLVRTSAANGVVSQQATRRASAVRLGSELSAWVQRGGHLALGMPLDQALELLSAQPPSQLLESTCCSPDACDSNASAWQYLALWFERFNHAMPDTRWVICSADMNTLDSVNASEPSGWSCGATGSVLLMKLGWATSRGAPAMVIPLGMVQ